MARIIMTELSETLIEQDLGKIFFVILNGAKIRNERVKVLLRDRGFNTP